MNKITMFSDNYTYRATIAVTFIQWHFTSARRSYMYVYLSRELMHPWV